MQHIYQQPHFGENWFTYSNFYKFIVNKFTTNSHFVEVGCWKGKSASFMAVEIINSNKNIKFDCVDTWLGTDSDKHYLDQSVKNQTLYDLFLSNMKPVENYYKALKMTSVDASKLYKNSSLDFVFIDADHEYESVKDDINAWLPKIKKGGIISGHDFIPNESNAFEGLKKAVKEAFKPEQLNIIENDRVWWVEI